MYKLLFNIFMDNVVKKMNRIRKEGDMYLHNGNWEITILPKWII